MVPMDNNKIKEMLPDYVQGLLSEEDSLAVKEQLEKSEPLRKEYEECVPITMQSAHLSL